MADTAQQTEAEPTLTSGAPVPVSVEYVEAQLNELWRDVAEAAQAQGGMQGVTTAHVLNLIVRAGSEDEAYTYLSDIQTVTGHHPSRIVAMITNMTEEERPVTAWVSIYCQIPPAGGRQVCAEQVTVMACGDSVRRMPAAVIPLLIPDLPVFLWWPRGTPFDDYLFRNLADSVNRLIVDSGTFENPEGTLAKMAARLAASWPKIAYSDINWARLLNWRELVAQFFDRPALRPYLDRIARVSIDYAVGGRGSANRAQALLMAGWLASRLGWEPAEPTYTLVRAPGGDDLPSTARLSMKSGKRAITVLVNASPLRGAEPGDLTGITLEVLPERAPGEQEQSEEVKPEAAFSVTLSEKEDECAWVGVQLSGGEQTSRHVQLDDFTRADLLDIELEAFSRDRVYEQALEMAGTFIRGIDQSAQGPTMLPRALATGEPISAGGGGPAPRVRPPEKPGPSPTPQAPEVPAPPAQPGAPPAPVHEEEHTPPEGTS